MSEKDGFISGEMSTIASIHFNDHGFIGSGILAKKYLKTAKQRVAEVKDPDSRRQLLGAINKINNDCDYLLGYHNNVESFREVKTIGIIQRIAKKIFILLHLGNMNIVHSGISHELRYFHSAICDLLIPNNSEPSFLKQKLEKK